MTVPLSFGFSDADRLAPLARGEVKLPGVQPAFHTMPLQDLFNLQLTEHPFDCCEFPIATFIRSFDARPAYVGLPVFPSRHFRLSCVFVNARSGIRHPSQLAGRRVGIPVFDMAAAVWLRGIFQDYHGLERRSPIYVNGGLDHGRTGDEHPQFYPPGFQIETVPRSLSDLLLAGEIDAIYAARAPSSFWSHPDRVVRLFENPFAAERAYFAEAGFIPPMHLVCLKRPIAERHPELPSTLFEAFRQSQQRAIARLDDSATLAFMLPWLDEHLRQTRAILGADFWPTGLAGNTAALTTLIRYMREDGLLQRDLTPNDLFGTAFAAT